jgi:sigma-B regulation protein RsbU (phosphoserine phosphatase)
MANFITRIRRTGIHEGLSFNETNKIRIFNNSALVLIAICFFYTVICAWIGFYLAACVVLVGLIAIPFGLYLIHVRLYQSAFHFVIVFACVYLVCFGWLFGEKMSTYLYLLFGPVISIIFFDNLKTIALYFAATLGIVVGLKYFMMHNQPFYPELQIYEYFSYLNLAFVCTLIYLGVKEFKTENLNYSSEIELQKEKLEEKNKEVTDSINYAKKIQEALLPKESDFKAIFPESFILFQPKDIVSGDFYWMCEQGTKFYYATADCTGHGVPGGFMTMLGTSFLNAIVNEKQVTAPDQVLNQLRIDIIASLKQTGISAENMDGMDIVFCCLDRVNRILSYAAANNSIYVLSHGKFNEYKPDKQPCGFYHDQKPFTLRQITLQEGDCIYTSTDGYADQFGGAKGKKFKYRQLEELLGSVQQHPMSEQKTILSESIQKWKGDLEQVDDILLIGLRV